MFRPLPSVAVIALAISVMAVCCPTVTLGVESQWVQHGTTGRLIYTPDAQGDRIADFSGVGYRAGKLPLPTIPTAIVVQPVAGDDTSSIQAAINQVSALPIGPDGFRGAVQLAAGEYEISGQLNITASGVVLRGAGREQDETVLRATGTSQRDLIRVLGSGSQSLTGSTRNMIDKTVPVGATSFRVDSTSGFSVGDTVRVTRPSTANWISDIGMDQLPPRPDGTPSTQWAAGSFDLRFDRTITRIEGDRVFIDAPLTNSFELQYGGGQIKRYNWDNRIENVGIEHLRAESDFAFDTDEDHSWNFVSIDKAQNVWVRDTTSAHFARSAVLSNPGAKWVTVDDAVNLDPKSRITGSRRYTFDLSGQLELVTNSEANQGRHDFVNNSSRPVGPHVFHNSVANDALDESGPHQRWATGTLFDNITVEGDQINARNRGYFGTGHGWAGANMVIWNSTAESYIVQNPPTAQNWLVGSTGEIITDTTFGPQPDGYIDSHGTRVDVDSLYEAQVADAADVAVFRWAGTTANWNDPEAWQQKLTPGNYQVESLDYLIGDIDNYLGDGAGSVDQAYIDPAWQAYIEATSSHPVTGFDDTATNRNVAFTIEHQLDPGQRVVHGTLALSLLQSGGDVDTDFLRLFDSDANHRLAFSDLGWDNQINSSEAFVGVADLGPYTSELQTGSVNVQVNDDTAVDWALYTITVASPIAGGGAASVVVDGGGQATVDLTIAGVNHLTVGGDSSGHLAILATGQLQVTGNYTQPSSGMLGIELANAGQPEAIAVGGDALIGGDLTISAAMGFDPTLGDSFDLLTAGAAVLGTFAAVELPTLAAGLAWEMQYAVDAVSLEVILAGDFNRDGSVDAGDYTLWRDSIGSTTELAADANVDGVVDSLDFAIWKTHFGTSAADFSGASSQAAAIPEPSALMLFGLFLACSSTLKLYRKQS